MKNNDMGKFLPCQQEMVENRKIEFTKEELPGLDEPLACRKYCMTCKPTDRELEVLVPIYDDIDENLRALCDCLRYQCKADCTANMTNSKQEKERSSWKQST